MTIITRFAPSPTNNLHLGHIYSARLGYEFAKHHGGQFVVRIEDIDHHRCKDEYTQQVLGDLAWLGLQWDGDIRYQSQHIKEYQDVIAQLDEMGVVYPCFCTKKEILAEIARAAQAPHAGEHIDYPGTCRNLSRAEVDKKMQAGVPYALRLNVAKAFDIIGHDLTWYDELAGDIAVTVDTVSDVVMARKDIGTTSYHISAVHDDYLQGVTHIIRGVDLFETTHIHVVLQALLGYPTPCYHHHQLLVDLETGHRLAKRNNSTTIKMIREDGKTPKDIFQLVDQYAAISVDGL